MKKELLAIFNNLRVALNFPAIAEDKHEEFSIEKEFIEKAQAAVDNSTALAAQVAQLTTDLTAANAATQAAEGLLATEKTAHQATKNLLAAEKAAHEALKAESAGGTITTQDTEDDLGDEKEKKLKVNQFDPKASRRKTI